MSHAESIRARIDEMLAAPDEDHQQAEGRSEVTIEATQRWLRILTEELIVLADFADALHEDMHALRRQPPPT